MIIPNFYRGIFQGSERLSDLCSVTQVVTVQAVLKPRTPEFSKEAMKPRCACKGLAGRWALSLWADGCP